MKTRPIPHPADRPVLTLVEAGEILGISRPVAYRLAANGEFPLAIEKLGTRRKVVRTTDLCKFLGVDVADITRAERPTQLSGTEH